MMVRELALMTAAHRLIDCDELKVFPSIGHE